MTRRVLVTGASGFVGSRTLGPLCAAGFDVHAVSRTPPPSRDGVTWWKADLLEVELARAVVQRVRPSHVLHCAWTVDYGRFWTTPDNLDWVGATLAIARASAETGVGRFVGVGTCAEYDWSDGGPLARREVDALLPGTLYGEAKAATFRVLQRFCAEAEISFAWGRIFHLYGKGEHSRRFVASLLADLAAGRPARVRNGALIRDYMAVEAAGQALSALLAATVKGAVNIASGQAATLTDLAAHVAEQANRPGHVQVSPPDPDCRDVPSMVAHTGRLTGEVGWLPPAGWPGLADVRSTG